MSTKALKSQLLAAVAMVLVSSIALGSSTYAWFAINTKVTATGMAVKTQVSNNLFIAPDTTDSDSAVDEKTFTTSLVQNVPGTLEPVSTVDGVNYFYTATNNAAVSGDALSDVYIAYNAGNTADFNKNYQTTGAVGYVDYAFRLKAINAGTAQQDVVLTGLNLVYGGKDDAGAPAYRVAMFVQDLGTTQGAGADVAANQVNGVYAVGGENGYKYQTAGMAVKAAADADPDVKAIASLEFNNKTINTASNSKIGTVDPGTTHYYKVVIRLWLEGEDKACTNTTFAALTDEWAMDVAVELKNEGAAATDGVAALTAKATASKAGLSSATAASAATITINGVSYYKIDTVKLGDKDLYTTAAGAVTNASRIYTLADGQYPIEVTNQCTLPA